MTEFDPQNNSEDWDAQHNQARLEIDEMVNIYLEEKGMLPYGLDEDENEETRLNRLYNYLSYEKEGYPKSVGSILTDKDNIRSPLVNRQSEGYKANYPLLVFMLGTCYEGHIDTEDDYSIEVERELTKMMSKIPDLSEKKKWFTAYHEILGVEPLRQDDEYLEELTEKGMRVYAQVKLRPKINPGEDLVEYMKRREDSEQFEEIILDEFIDEIIFANFLKGIFDIEDL